jgi:hypothetical protein
MLATGTKHGTRGWLRAFWRHGLLLFAAMPLEETDFVGRIADRFPGDDESVGESGVRFGRPWAPFARRSTGSGVSNSSETPGNSGGRS